ncbi:MAG: hypothetical protein ACE5NM_07715 [Sedimentisphaerales bacterium]
MSRESVLAVLDRAGDDYNFIAELTDHGSEALREYDLTWEEAAALVSGDIRWIEAHVGKLTDKQKTWLNCRLQQEKW